ncbi:MAG: hypothetical protein FWG19_00695 [Methanomassiliicoccaceae archaeon]|nr:hypothetical protein [Methanomassiliicoccaceae archaeon]
MDRYFETTLIGSLPFDDPAYAIDRILDSGVTYPAWPQLPALGYSESMYVQTGCNLPNIEIDLSEKKITVDIPAHDPYLMYEAIVSENIDYFKHPQKYHKGFYEFLSRDLSGLKGLKGQVTGPVSEGLQILDKEGRSVLYDDSYAELVRHGVNMTAKWQLNELRKHNKNVIMFFDEPSLTLLGTPFASVSREQAWDILDGAMEGLDCEKAIHCCGNTDWSVVLNTELDILSFDAYAYGHTIAMFPEEISAFLEKGGTLAWGIIPSGDDLIETENVDGLVKKFKEDIGALVKKGMDEDLIIRRSMVTPQCGLGGMDPKNVDKAFDLLFRVAEKMKEHYGVK